MIHLQDVGNALKIPTIPLGEWETHLASLCFLNCANVANKRSGDQLQINILTIPLGEWASLLASLRFYLVQPLPMNAFERDQLQINIPTIPLGEWESLLASVSLSRLDPLARRLFYSAVLPTLPTKV